MSQKSLSFVLIGLFISTVSEARVLECVSKSRACAYQVQIEAVDEPAVLTVLPHLVVDAPCFLTPGQTLVLTPSPFSSSQWPQFDGLSKQDRRKLELRFDHQQLMMESMRLNLNIGLADHPSAFHSTSMDCE